MCCMLLLWARELQIRTNDENGTMQKRKKSNGQGMETLWNFQGCWIHLKLFKC